MNMGETYNFSIELLDLCRLVVCPSIIEIAHGRKSDIPPMSPEGAVHRTLTLEPRRAWFEARRPAVGDRRNAGEQLTMRELARRMSVGSSPPVSCRSAGQSCR